MLWRRSRVSPQQTWPLWWRVSLWIRVQTMLNHIRFVKSQSTFFKKSISATSVTVVIRTLSLIPIYKSMISLSSLQPEFLVWLIAGHGSLKINGVIRQKRVELYINLQAIFCKRCSILRTFAPKSSQVQIFLKLWLQLENDKIRLKTLKKSGVTELVLKIRRITDHSVSRISSHSGDSGRIHHYRHIFKLKNHI